MWWRILILFLPTSSFRIKKFCCMYLKTMEQWSKWSLKAGVLQWDMFPGSTELHLIGCSIESIWTPRSKSNTSTPKTNSLTFWPKETSRVMSGIICCACSKLAISVLQFVLIQQRNDLDKIQERIEVTAKSRLVMNLGARTPSFVLQFQWARGKILRKSKSMEFNRYWGQIAATWRNFIKRVVQKVQFDRNL